MHKDEQSCRYVYNLHDEITVNGRRWADHINRLDPQTLPRSLGRSLGRPRAWVPNRLFCAVTVERTCSVFTRVYALLISLQISCLNVIVCTCVVVYCYTLDYNDMLLIYGNVMWCVTVCVTHVWFPTKTLNKQILDYCQRTQNIIESGNRLTK